MATTDTNTTMTMRVAAAPAAGRATGSSLRGRMGRGAIVVAAHVAVICAVAASLGIVRSPISAEPMQAVMITETQPEQKPLQPIKPELATPNRAEVALPEPEFEGPVEEAPPAAPPAENAISASAEPAATPST